MTQKGLTRREFLVVSGTAAAGTVLAVGLGFDLSPAEAYARELRIKGAKETTTVCCYCSVGCGILVHTREGRVINSEGDPDHPINEGALCAKGAALYQMTVNKNRMKNPLYRAPESDEWEEIEWDEAIEKIAEKIKETRDATFTEKNAKGQVVNRTTGIAHVGSAALDNEECYLLAKMTRALGVVYLEHHARI